MRANNERFFYGEEARDILKKGVNMLGDMVGASLGPGGRLICIGQESLSATTTKDGVTIAKHMKLDSPYNLGAEMIQSASKRLLKYVGDGTTTATVLAQSLVNNGFNMIERKRINVRTLVGQLSLAKEEALKLLEAQKIIGGEHFNAEDIVDISTNGDAEIKDLIIQAYKEVGEHGLILVNESKSIDSFLERTNGYLFESPLLSENFIKDKSINYIRLENVRILLYDKKLEQIEPIKDILIQCSEEGVPLVVIAEDFSVEVVSLFTMNYQRDIVQVIPIKAPAYGSLKDSILEDIAALTGATLITANKGLSIGDSRWSDLGHTEAIVIKNEHFILESPAIDKDRLLDRIANAQMEVTNNAHHFFLEELYKKRLAKLTASSVSIMVGGITDLDVKEKIDRYDDAIKALMSAVKDGVLPGGGVAFLRAQIEEQPSNFGATLLNKALFSPYKTILSNASISDTTLKDVLTKEGRYYRINKSDLSIGLYNTMAESRCIDPYAVARESLITAVEVATAILLTEGLIVRSSNGVNPNIEEESIEI